MNIYETIIVGGGPGGLTAAIHLAWHDRNVLVIDRKTGPLFFTLENLYNVPGIWVAGDLRPMTQQVAVAMGTGNIAAIMIDQHLRKKQVL